ncbi:hypothetical protein [Marisediminicola sp. LYQ134]|uniref:hypothetical protein n=1 Tax=Marisediminicola sp. LYQ134 TaxID=3391061 RepID=UPI0039833737
MTTPSRRERFRPLELLAFSGGAALVVGLVVLMSTRQFDITFIGAGIVFIVTLVVIAMLALVATPDDAEQTDIDGQTATSKSENAARDAASRELPPRGPDEGPTFH